MKTTSKKMVQLNHSFDALVEARAMVIITTLEKTRLNEWHRTVDNQGEKIDESTGKTTHFICAESIYKNSSYCIKLEGTYDNKYKYDPNDTDACENFMRAWIDGTEIKNKSAIARITLAMLCSKMCPEIKNHSDLASIAMVVFCRES